MVRIQWRVSKKCYLRSKHTYEYERITIHVPRRFHNTVKPFLKQDLDINVVTEKDSLVITLTPLKTFRPPNTAKSAMARIIR